jgi:hypothetical protein
VPKPEKVCESVPKLEKFGESMRMCGKCYQNKGIIAILRVMIGEDTIFWLNKNILAYSIFRDKF